MTATSHLPPWLPDTQQSSPFPRR